MQASALKMDSLLQEEFLLPVQYADLLRGATPRPPEHGLLFAVLEDAVRCWQTYGNSTDRRSQHLFQEVAQWFASDDDASPFTFVAICHLFALEPDCIRDGLRRWSERERVTGHKAAPLRVRRASGLRHAVTGRPASAGSCRHRKLSMVGIAARR
jgi:hypothetical protein